MVLEEGDALPDVVLQEGNASPGLVLKEDNALPDVVLQLEMELGEEWEISPDIVADVVLQEVVSPDVVLWEGDPCCWGRDCECSQINCTTTDFLGESARTPFFALPPTVHVIVDEVTIQPRK